MTQLQMINKLLRRLREDVVASVTETDYGVLMADFINEAIDEVSSAHDWRRFQYTSYAQLELDSSNYVTSNVYALDSSAGSVLAAVGDAKVLTDRSKLVAPDTSVSAVMYNRNAAGAINNTDWVPLWPVDHAEWLRLYYNEGGTAQSSSQYPTYYSVSYKSTNDYQPIISVWPPVDTQGTLMLRHFTPPSALTVTGTDADTTVPGPETPVFEYALMLALNERGEEMGEPGNLREARYTRALQKAIEDDLLHLQRTDKFDWRRD